MGIKCMPPAYKYQALEAGSGFAACQGCGMNFFLQNADVLILGLYWGSSRLRHRSKDEPYPEP